MAWRILKYILHQFCLRHRKGFGIHSPSLFDLIHGAVFNANRWEVPGQAVRYHRDAAEDRTRIEAAGFGARSKVDGSSTRSVRSFVRGSSVNRKYGALLYRMARWTSPDFVIELGTGLGVSTAYLAAGAGDVPVHTIEGNSGRAAYAAERLRICGFENVSVHQGAIGTILPETLENKDGILLAFADGDHRFEPTISYVRTLISRAGGKGVIILDDIYWSKEMYRAWKEIISWTGVRVSIDLFHFGVLLLREDLHKKHLKLNF